MNRFKSWCDYLWYVVRHDKFILIASVIDAFLLGYVLYTLRSDLSEAKTWIIFGIILFSFLWQAYNVWSHWKSTIKSVNYEISDEPIVNLKYSEGDDSKGDAEGDKFILSNDMQKAYAQIPGIPQYVEPTQDLSESFFSNNPIQIQEKEHHVTEVNEYVQSVWTRVQLFLNVEMHKEGNFFNEKKLCMTSEIKPAQNGGWEVFVCKGEYYNSYVTNSVFNRTLKEKTTGVEIYPIYNAQNYIIPLLHDSKLSNHIGVSSLITSNDGTSYMIRQNTKAVENSGKIVPTGSGSVDYQDAKGCQYLQQVIIKAAERELFEETTFNAELLRNKVTTKIIGFYRDLSRGGKPEFCCVTEVDLPSASLADLIVPQVQEQYTGERIPLSKNDFADGLKLRNPSSTLLANIYFWEKYQEQKEAQ